MISQYTGRCKGLCGVSVLQPETSGPGRQNMENTSLEAKYGNLHSHAKCVKVTAAILGSGGGMLIIMDQNCGYEICVLDRFDSLQKQFIYIIQICYLY